MKKVIKRYYSDSEFYQKQSEYALQRVKRLLDTDGEFVKIISEMERREQCKAQFQVGSGGCMQELLWQITEYNKRVCITDAWNVIGYVDTEPDPKEN